MVAMEESRFVVRKDLFEECLILSPYPDWEEEMRQIREKVNMYNRAENKFYRQYRITSYNVCYTKLLRKYREWICFKYFSIYF